MNDMYEMPGLSAYLFDRYGRVYNKKKKVYVSMANTVYYVLSGDNGIEHVYKREIMLYVKHLIVTNHSDANYRNLFIEQLLYPQIHAPHT